MTNILLAFHLLGAADFFVGGAVVGVLQLRASQQERPSQVYAFLRRAPLGVALVGTGSLLTLGFGIALAEHEGIGLKPAWIQASLGLWVAAMVLGAYGGRTARHARHLAQKLAAEGDEPSPELRAMVAARGPLSASYASFVLLLAIVVLMVWQPGGSAQAGAPTFILPKYWRQQLLDTTPQFAWLPTRVPRGFKYSYYQAYPSGGFRSGLYLTFKGATGRDELSFSAGALPKAAGRICEMPTTRTSGSLTVNGNRIFWARNAYSRSAFRCVGNDSVLLEADSPPQHGVARKRASLADLETVVAYAEPIR